MNREALLASAEELFAFNAFSEVSIDQIVERAGVGKGTFYNHFRNKAHIAQELATAIRTEVRSQIGLIKSASSDPAIHLALAVLMFLKLAEQQPNRANILVALLTNAHDSRAEMNTPVMQTLATGRQQGRFSYRLAETALAVVLGIVSGAMRSLIENRVFDPQAHMTATTEHALASLGVGMEDSVTTAAEAQRILDEALPRP